MAHRARLWAGPQLVLGAVALRAMAMSSAPASTFMRKLNDGTTLKYHLRATAGSGHLFFGKGREAGATRYRPAARALALPSGSSLSKAAARRPPAPQALLSRLPLSCSMNSPAFDWKGVPLKAHTSGRRPRLQLWRTERPLPKPCSPAAREHLA